ncbi:excinuclease ABC subunit UvrC [Pseudomonas matsuisoli]|uniref:UvrABC system protein C n=1 Tax=Pseudomonas matsuisoli TaxID=1515666 RepID=A0A917UTY1_9PSED|nr:excinuclease ABC subunit UvrC [Pseudomonas matsuisoli]GGJ84879.1 UvrABC system protein C [Pseudomonas matsuisoli]
MSQPFDSSAFLASCSGRPGVYRMFDDAGKLLYVGKARNLKKRVASYFRKTGLATKTSALVAKIAQIETTITANETEALLLEQTLIKEWRPPYNILLRDDKSYPYVYLSSEDQFPRLGIHRGAKKAKGRYFGPYPSAGSIRESLSLLQKAFHVRQCEDAYFKNRTRPCLQYQIKRCKGPCVGLVDADEYAQDVRHSVMFLEGRSNALAEELQSVMEQAAMRLDFERAAELRDQVGLLRRVQDQQSMEGGSGDVDVIAAIVSPGGACVHLISVRSGRVLGSKNFFPQVGIEEDTAGVLMAFLAQYYLASERDLPEELIVNATHEDFSTLTAAIAASRGRAPNISYRVRATRAKWQQLAVTNAQQALSARLANRQHLSARFDALAEALDLDEPPQRMECFDISHSSGEATVASCVVFGPEGPLKSDYRRYNIEGVTAGDDYAAMRQALTRRFSKVKAGEGKLPDILLVDGGKGQLAMAKEVLLDLAMSDLTLLGVAKGVTRKPGLETLYLNDAANEFTLPGDSPALHLIQQIRDEAHRFAITGHRARRGKTRRTSTLEGIDGVGPKRRRDLLKYFGGLQEVSRASVDEIAKAPGISKKLAESIYAALHSE